MNIDFSAFKKPDRVHVLPLNWVEVQAPDPAQRAYIYQHPFFREREIHVVCGFERHEGKWWLHVSASCHRRIPIWQELRTVKDIFIGKERMAIQILPKESEYVNINPYVLHLWAPLEHKPLPDFRKIRGGLGV